MNLTVSVGQAKNAAHLQDTVRALNLSQPASKSSLDEFFELYSHFNGSHYAAAWNKTQTLGWLGEAGGLGEIAAALEHLSSEVWAFPQGSASAHCPLAVDFSPNVAVSPTNCFFLSSLEPTDTQVSQRYSLLLTPAQLSNLTEEFQKGRAASLALGYASAMSTGNVAPQVQAAWNDSKDKLNAAYRVMVDEVASPMDAVSGNIEAMASSSECHPAYEVFVFGSKALGGDFVSELVALSSCYWVLSCSTLGLTVLYCHLWQLREPGAKGRLNDKLDRAGTAAPEDEDYESADDEEIELQRPLTGANSA